MSPHATTADRFVPSIKVAGRAHSEIVVARRYLDHGFLDAAMRIFTRNVALASTEDWHNLAARLLDRGRIVDAVTVCETGGVPLPRQTLLELGDRLLSRKDVDAALRYYALASADQERWTNLLYVLTRLPGRELQAKEVAERLLVGRAEPAHALPLAAWS
jgi:hypothetical protein